MTSVSGPANGERLDRSLTRLIEPNRTEAFNIKSQTGSIWGFRSIQTES